MDTESTTLPTVQDQNLGPALIFVNDDFRIIRAALTAHRWSRSLAVKALGISRSTLWRRMQELGIE